jgi:TPR repeat protein
MMWEVAGGIIVGVIGLRFLTSWYKSWETKRAIKRGQKVLDLIMQRPVVREAMQQPATSHQIAIAQLTRKAEQGDAHTQMQLGDIYYTGNGVPQDYVQAYKWYRQAAEQGDVTAQYGLGAAYDDGIGVTKDHAEALKWYFKAAAQDDADAQCGLGFLYLDGKGVAQDFNEASIWFKKAAEKGNATAQGVLGVLYFDGKGIPQSFEESYFWLTVALPANAGASSARDKVSCQLTPQQLSNVQQRAAEWKQGVGSV